jgi:hypothetical protein
MEEISQQLELLARYRVECVIVGGVAAALYGSSIPTYDVDVCYARDKDNLDRLAQALIAVHASLRGAPTGLPFMLDAETLRRGLNFTFDTDLGPLDLLGEVSGVGGFAEAREGASIYELFGHPYPVLAIDKLIAAKRAAGRKKDLDIIPELEAIRELMEKERE